MRRQTSVSKIKLPFSILVSVLPFNTLRVLGYRLLGYKVTSARIGFGTIIAVAEANLDSCRISPFNLFIGPFKLIVRRGASIGSRNEFSCGYWVLRDEYAASNYTRTLEIGTDALITSRHHFDIAGTFVLGDRSWIAGIGSQFWTHGAGVTDRDIRIGSDCYLGSAVRFAPGSSIGNKVVVAMGSVVSTQLNVDNALVGGVPAKILKENYNWKSRNE
jgi:acetyltransferase-like isoleucine patch superfamily enzyme